MAHLKGFAQGHAWGYSNGRQGRIARRTVRRIAAALATGVTIVVTGMTLTACSFFQHGDGTLTIWWFDDATTAQTDAWNTAVEIYTADHPDITVTVEQKSWTELSQSAETVLSDENAPDVVQWVPGPATEALVAAGKLAGLNDYVSTYTWNELLPSSALQTGQYDGARQGSGAQYGIPNEARYSAWFYNADMLKAYGVDPLTLTSPQALTAAFDVFAAQGVTPVASAGDDLTQLAYAFALEKADRDWVNDYQFFTNEVYFNGPQITHSSQTIVEWSSKQYLSSNAASASSADAIAAFTQGMVPFYFGDSVVDSQIAATSAFSWGKFLHPTSLGLGSATNNWVIPANSVNKDQAAEFINDTLSEKSQNALADGGGLALAVTVEPAATVTAMSLPLLQQLLAADALAFYPQWPVPHYLPVLSSAAADLLAGRTDAATYRQTIGQYYFDNSVQ